MGLPGSGKTWLASRLAAETGALYISSDRLRKKLGLCGNYSDAGREAVYREMMRCMEEGMMLHRDMVLDASFHRKAARREFQEAVGSREKTFFIEVRADEALVRERLKKPRADSEADFEVYRKIRTGWESPEFPHLVLVSTDDNIDELLAKAADYLPLKR